MTACPQKEQPRAAVATINKLVRFSFLAISITRLTSNKSPFGGRVYPLAQVNAIIVAVAQVGILIICDD
jgi:hypothetical protein